MSESPRARIPSYVGSLTTFSGALAAAVAVGRRRGARLATGYSLLDLAVGGLATHKFSRLVAKDGVTTPLRAPFTVFEEETGSAEVAERPRDEHPLHTIGELLVCPFCLAPWVAAAYVAGLSLAPSATRAWAATFAIVGASDFLQHGYARVRSD